MSDRPDCTKYVLSQISQDLGSNPLLTFPTSEHNTFSTEGTDKRSLHLLGGDLLHLMSKPKKKKTQRFPEWEQVIYRVILGNRHFLWSYYSVFKNQLKLLSYGKFC